MYALYDFGVIVVYSIYMHKILIVDDEPDLLSITKLLLGKMLVLKYVEYQCGKTFIRKFLLSNQKLYFLIYHLVMQMAELFARILRQRKKLRIYQC